MQLFKLLHSAIVLVGKLWQGIKAVIQFKFSQFDQMCYNGVWLAALSLHVKAAIEFLCVKFDKILRLATLSLHVKAAIEFLCVEFDKILWLAALSLHAKAAIEFMCVKLIRYCVKFDCILLNSLHRISIAIEFLCVMCLAMKLKGKIWPDVETNEIPGGPLE